MIESRPGNQAADGSEGFVRPDAAGCIRKAEPDTSAAAFDTPGKSTIVNDLTANGCNAARIAQGLRTDQNAPSCSSRDFAIWVCNPCGRIEHEKEEDKRGDECAFRESLAMEFDHYRDQIESRFGHRNQALKVIRGMDDVSVREQQVIRIDPAGTFNSLLNGPEFPRPSCRQWKAGDDGKLGVSPY